jgi:hypothetical protein
MPRVLVQETMALGGRRLSDVESEGSFEPPVGSDEDYRTHIETNTDFVPETIFDNPLVHPADDQLILPPSSSPHDLKRHQSEEIIPKPCLSQPIAHVTNNMSASSPLSPPRRKSLVRRAAPGAKKWPGLQSGILSTQSQETSGKSLGSMRQGLEVELGQGAENVGSLGLKRAREGSSSLGPARKKVKKVEGSQVGTQTKLGQFGFWGDGKGNGRARKSGDESFEKKWDDEEDLEFEEPGNPGEMDAGESSVLGFHDKGRMRPVPEAPYHPLLKPAGVREMRRRAGQYTAPTSTPPMAVSQRQRTVSPRARQRHDGGGLGADSADASRPADVDDHGHECDHEPPLFPPSTSNLSPMKRMSSSSSGEVSASTNTTPRSEFGYEEESGGGQGDTARWWAAMGTRRASEFGSF